jgi:hypothetical protein
MGAVGGRTIILIFFLFICVSYIFKKYSDFLKMKKYSDFGGIKIFSDFGV